MAQEFSPDSDFAALETPRVVPPRSLAITALARFEFEAGRGNEGTKILMVEWEDDDLTRSPVGSWHVSWDGKKTVLPADERTNEHTRRFYFLLPPGVTIPPVVTLTYEPPPSSASTAKRPDSLQINPLPAIFPPELGSTARTSGKKGVLHTIWAKKRLQALEKEIKEESKYNLEGVALEMAIREREWIESNFGVAGRPGSLNTNNLPSYPGAPLSPASPRSPTSGRKLSEKLKGLKLGTSEKDLARKPDGKSDQNSLCSIDLFLVSIVALFFAIPCLSDPYHTNSSIRPRIASIIPGKPRRRHILLQLVPQHTRLRCTATTPCRRRRQETGRRTRPARLYPGTVRRWPHVTLHGLCCPPTGRKHRRRIIRKGPESENSGYPQKPIFVFL